MKKIAVMRGGAIGDFVLTLPAIDALRAFHRIADLCLIGNPAILSLARPDRTVDHGSQQLAPLYSRDGRIPSETAALFADVDLLLAYAVSPAEDLADHLRRLVPGQLLIHDPRPLPAARIHMVDHLLAPVEQAGIPVADRRPRIHLAPGAPAYARSIWADRPLAPPVVILHTGSGGMDKCWPERNYLQLADRLERHGASVLILQGPVEAERRPPLPNRHRILHPPGLPELAALLARADLFIGNDTGPGHIAAAVGTSTLSIFGPTDPDLWRPCGDDNRVLRAPNGRMEDLDVDPVLTTALEILSTAAGDHV